MNQGIYEVDVISYIDDYPTVVQIDVQNVTEHRPYRVGDINNILPPGVKVLPKHSTALHHMIFDVEEDPII